jgi:hypothetical protein
LFLEIECKREVIGGIWAVYSLLEFQHGIVALRRLSDLVLFRIIDSLAFVILVHLTINSWIKFDVLHFLIAFSIVDVVGRGEDEVGRYQKGSAFDFLSFDAREVAQ